MVTGEDQYVFGIKPGDKGQILINGIGSALIPLRFFALRVGGQNLGAAVGLVKTPGLAVADVLIQLLRLILGEDTNSIDAGIDAVGEGKVNNAVLAAEGNGRLCGVLGEDLQAAALSAG